MENGRGARTFHVPSLSIDSARAFLQVVRQGPGSRSAGKVMNDQITIEALQTNAANVDCFLKLSYSVYNGDPHWVAPLLMDLKKVFTEANPLFEHAVMQLWIASR